ncbi:ATP-binding cassette domain-containing protein [Helcococcus kunzii]|uniref:ATP-binding cassette domain-containing protein n=1 Tax=Helcococcus kunzii TaxID=40091 RepID=UPI0021A750B4|nr:ATP-binding cassette domain-containing protein [Helcococcus kunzii]
MSFFMEKKDVLGLIGKNGTGKSTILKMVNRLVEPDSGQILYDGNDIITMNDKELRNIRKEIVYIFQDANLLENKTVYYHLSLVYKLNNKKIDEDEIDEILDFMNLSRLKNSYTYELSGGQKQKVAIAIAILQKPKILLCDEITSALDTEAEREILTLLEKIRERYEVSIMIISHNLSVLKNFCNKILFLEDNTIKDIIIPNKSQKDDEEDYYEYIARYLRD